MFYPGKYAVGLVLRPIFGILVAAGLSCARGATLVEAVEAPLSWETGGNAPWLAETDVTQDGIDAAASGSIVDAQETWIQAIVTGPGPLSFWWKASSELGYDELQFLIDGVEQISISGEVDWQQRTFSIASGEHVLTWRYVKDPSDSAGLDKGWLDQVVYSPPGEGPPRILVQPASQTVAAGSVVSFRVAYSGLPEPTRQWFFNGNPLIGETNSILTLNNVTTSQGGTYVVVLSNRFGSVTSVAASLTVTLIGDVLEALELPWAVGGDAPWFGESSVSHDGLDAAESGAITNSQQSWIETTLVGPGEFAFWWKVSSEAFYDGLQFLTNGVVAASLSGESIWERKVFSLPKGSQTLRWRYFKDGSITLGQDKGWLDEVTYVANKPPSGLNVALNNHSVNENDAVILTGSFVDPDIADTHVVTITWGDGSPQTVTNLAADTHAFSLVHQYRDDDPAGTSSDTYVINVAVSDEAGTNSVSIPLQVNNLPPVLSNVVVTLPRFPYEPVTLSADIGDAGTRDTLRLFVNWGDGSPAEASTFDAQPTSFTLRHTYTVAGASLFATLSLTDDDGGDVSLRASIVLPPAPAGARISSIEPRPNGDMLLRLQGTERANYQVQASQDLKTWLTIGVRQAGANGLFEVLDMERELYRQRFYRVIWESQSTGIRLGGITKRANGHFLLRVIGLPGTSCRIETSTDRIAWSPLGTVSVGTTGTTDLEQGLPVVSRRFYRGVLLP